MATILVTGATGNVGKSVYESLQQSGQSVRAAVRTINHTASAGEDVVAFDFAQPTTFAPALIGIKQIFLMRPPAISDTQHVINPFIDAAKAAGVEQIVLLSLLGAESNPLVPHYRIEHYLQKVGIGWTFLRPSFFMQNLTTTHLRDLRDEHRIMVPAGNGRTSFIDARDIAEVAVLTLTQPGHVGRAYDLTGAEALTYTEVAALISEVLGWHVSYTDPSLLVFAQHMHQQGFAPSFVLVMSAIYTTARLGLAAKITPDVAQLLGRPPTTMRQFISDSRALLTAEAATQVAHA